VLEKRVQLECELVGDEDPWLPADQHNLQHAKSGRESNFDKVKPVRGGHIEIRIDMVRIVKSPQEARSMIGAMPVVKRYIEQKKADNPQCDLGQRQERHQASSRMRVKKEQ